MTAAPGDEHVLAQRLLALGLSAGEAAHNARLFAEQDRVLDAWQSPGESGRPRVRWFVPGRIEILGKHTDYAGGRSLVCAVERGFCVTVAPRTDDLLRLVDVPNQVEAAVRVREDQPAVSRWPTYPATVARRVARNFPPQSGTLRGADFAFASDLPRAAGLSSSTALIIAVFTALAELNDLEQHPAYRANLPTIDALASYLGCVENGRTFGTLIGDSGVGTLGGAQDHTAILRAEPGRLLRYAYSPPHAEQVVPLPAGFTFAIGASGVAAEKTGAAREQYNRASRAVGAIMEIWSGATVGASRDLHVRRTLFDAVAHDPAERAELRHLVAQSHHAEFSADLLLARFDQFVREALEIVPEATAAIAAGDLATFGRLVDDSQAAVERWLHNQIPETIALARLARSLGAAASSAFGAGFGGSVWALVPIAEAPAFLAAWRDDYLARFPAHGDRATFFPTTAGPPRTRL